MGRCRACIACGRVFLAFQDSLDGCGSPQFSELLQLVLTSGLWRLKLCFLLGFLVTQSLEFRPEFSPFVHRLEPVVEDVLLEVVVKSLTVLC